MSFDSGGVQKLQTVLFCNVSFFLVAEMSNNFLWKFAKTHTHLNTRLLVWISRFNLREICIKLRAQNFLQARPERHEVICFWAFVPTGNEQKETEVDSSVYSEESKVSRKQTLFGEKPTYSIVDALLCLRILLRHRQFNLVFYTE